MLQFWQKQKITLKLAFNGLLIKRTSSIDAGGTLKKPKVPRLRQWKIVNLPSSQNKNTFWATFVRTFGAKNSQKSPNLVTLVLIIFQYLVT